MNNSEPRPIRSRLYLFFVGFAFLVSCSNSKTDSETKPLKDIAIAKVFDREIYQSEIGDFPKKDSALMIQMYLEKVAVEEALLQKANASNLVDMTEVDEKTKEFRKTLISIRFERELIKQRLDTNITEQEVKEYFDQNASSLLLEQDIFKGYFIKLPLNTPKISHLKDLMQSEKEPDCKEIKSYCLRYASSFSIDHEHWNVFPHNFELKQDFNPHSINQFIRNKQILSLEKEDNLYLVRLFDFKFAKQPSPISYSHDKIRHLLLNKKKMQLLGQFREQLLNEAKSNKNIEIY